MGSRSSPERALPAASRRGVLRALVPVVACLAGTAGVSARRFAHAARDGQGGGASFDVRVKGDDGRPLASAVVAVFVEGTEPNARPGTIAHLAQQSRQFVPGVLAIQTGTEVSFPNLDTVRHHVYSFSDVKRFEIKLYVGTPGQTVVFDRAGTAVLGCNIHDRMVGHVHVVDTPWFAVTDAQGRASIDVPTGTHRLQLWHPDMGPNAAPVRHAVQVREGGAPFEVGLAVRGQATR